MLRAADEFEKTKALQKLTKITGFWFLSKNHKVKTDLN